MASDINTPTPVSISGQDGDELLQGGAGNDTIVAYGGNDTLEGGAGNDQLRLMYGDQHVVRLGPGFGSDTLTGFIFATATVEFLAGIDASQLQVSTQRSGDKQYVVLSVAGTSDALYIDALTLTSQRDWPPLSVSFSDGTRWTGADIQSRLAALVGTEQDDVISNQGLLQTVRGLGGNDDITGAYGNVRLQGDAGDDILSQGQAGKVLLLGGAGNDLLRASQEQGATLWGGAGHDIYELGYNSGAVIEAQSGEAPEDSSDLVDVRSMNLTTPSFVTAKASARIETVNGHRDLVLTRADDLQGASALRVRNIDDTQLSGLQFRLDGNSPYSLAEMVSWAQTGTLVNNVRPAQWLGSERADTLYGGLSDDTLIGLGGADTLYATSGHDLLIGGDGGDIYKVSSYQADIVETGAANKGLDVLELAQPLSTTQVKVSGQDLVILARDFNGDVQTTVKGFYATDPALHSGIDRYDFVAYGGLPGADFSLTPEAMVRTAAGITQSADGESDLLLGGDAADDLQGGSRQALGYEDYLIGGAGDDTIRVFSGVWVEGGEGNDSIVVQRYRGETGAMSINGGAGNDSLTLISDDLSPSADILTLTGGTGSDTYVIKANRAVVTIDAAADASDTVLLMGSVLQAPVTAQEVTVRRYSYYTYNGGDSDFLLQWGNVNGQPEGSVRLTYTAGDAAVAFSDGTRWSQADLVRLSTVGTEANDYLFGSKATADLLLGGSGNDTLEGWGGNDTYEGGAGNDILTLSYPEYYFSPVIRFGPGDGADQVNLGQYQYPAPYNATLELSAETKATDWSLVSVYSPDGGNGYAFGYAHSTFLYKPTGDSIVFDHHAWSGVDDTPLSVRFGANGPALTLAQFRTASSSDPIPVKPPEPLLLQGTTGADSLVGGILNDTLIGLDGNDTLTGGRGNDVIDVGYGDDVVRHALGDGDDTVVVDVDGHVTLELDGPFLPADLSVQQQDDGARLSFGALSGSITFAFDINLGVPNIEIRLSALGSSAGSTSIADLLPLNPSMLNIGTALLGSDDADTLRGSFGRDTLDGGAGADVLMGGSNNDVYRGGAGDDLIMDRPEPNDPRLVRAQVSLRGGQDTYLFGRGDGVDTVIDIGTSSRDDILQFGEGIRLADIELVRRSVVGPLDSHSPNMTTNLPQLDYKIYRIKGTGDEIRFTADVPEVSPGPEWLRFADGTVVQASDLLVDAAAPLGMNVSGTALAENWRGTTLADTLAGGLGNDTLNGAAGSDQYIFAVGDGIDLIHESPQNAYSDDVDTLTLHGDLSLDTLKFSRNIVALDRFRPLTTIDGITNVHSLVYAYTDVIDLGAGAGQVQVSWLPDDSATLTSDRVEQNLGVLEQIKLDNGQSLNGNELLQRVLAGGVSLRGTNYAAALSGASGHDLVEAGSEADSLSGWAGNDTLRGNGGDDVLTGGLGNDLLDGGAGADTYKFSVGDGSDTIHADGLDTIALGAGLTKANVQIGKLGAKVANAVVLGVGSNAADTITLDNAGTWAGLQLKFVDGSSLTGADILLAATKPDNLTLTGTTKADVLTGKDGNDTLSGLAGNDTLAGGKGNDSLIGGKGNDTYLFNRGEGQDVIVDTDSTWFNSDLLKVGGATSKQLWLTKSGSNLDIRILGTSDKVTVQNWFAGSANQVEKITASDGKSLSASKVQALVNAMASFTPPADATSLPTNTPTSVTKLVASSWV